MVSLSTLPLGIILVLADSSAVVKLEAFTPSLPILPSAACATTTLGARAASSKKDTDVDGWTSLTQDGGVKMRVVSSASPGAPSPVAGDTVTVDYVGSLAAREWSVEDVVACWLPDRGASALAPALFRSFEIDGTRLADAGFLTAEFADRGLGLGAAKAANLRRAARELADRDATHPPGRVFDENAFAVELGTGGAIRAFELALPEMRVGDTAELVARCDYAYGKDGTRRGGELLVPPYATVGFDLTLVEIK